MDIKVYGPGCKKCVKLKKNVMDALAELDVAANVEKVEDMAEIAKAGILSTPGLEINGDVKVKGRLVKVGEIKDLIEAEL
ncbi:thioredoxin family protein [Selenihalanaerobacter shriftii]|uniref:Small redox-active disulfide protein 2 n=1 Tax=Selenihalanaerobacter shriftii TaxID=142842 RepID=A0A1T4PE92_9FIRM|nr:thioredoxin family protein [Selenihalanaerobacter shriftii]SJZ89657.1 small redox-active disulfide protein 2 [Selenihalanaerobacter shriftii]